jgi:hypothetical protein
MAYYEIAKLRERCLGNASDSSQDTLLGNFGVQADAQVDDEIYTTASKNARLSALPVLPMTTVPQTIKDCSTDRATAMFFLQQHLTDIHDRYIAASREAVRAYVLRLEPDALVYGTIL